jgi:protein-L-isoaspartate O-methyltransferase
VTPSRRRLSCTSACGPAIRSSCSTTSLGSRACGRGSRVLALACGAGQATVSLARRGYEVVAVELGRGLADVARRKLPPFPAVRVVHAAIEAWPAV